jgi:hypothetical protein
VNHSEIEYTEEQRASFRRWAWLLKDEPDIREHGLQTIRQLEQQGQPIEAADAEDRLDGSSANGGG